MLNGREKDVKDIVRDVAEVNKDERKRCTIHAKQVCARE